MADGNTSAPAETADVNPNDMLALANSLPDDALDFEEGDTEDTSEAPHEPRRALKAPEASEDSGQDGGSHEEAPAAEQDGEDETAEEDAPEPDAEAKAEPEKKDEPEAKTVRIDGHDIPIEEVRRGFMRQADYTRKTQALAEDGREVQALRQQTEAERAELGNILNVAVEVLKNRMPAPPDKALIRTDPMAFMEQQQAYQDAVEEVNKLLSGQQQVGQHQSAEQRRAAAEQHRAGEEAQRATAAALQHEAARMVETMPELRTAEGQRAFMTEAVEHGRHYGLTDQDIGAIQDHRALRVLKDAIAFRKLQAAKPAALERVKTAPPIRPATRQAPGTRSGDHQKRAMDRLRREGTIEAAAATLDDSLFE